MDLSNLDEDDQTFIDGNFNFNCYIVNKNIFM